MKAPFNFVGPNRLPLSRDLSGVLYGLPRGLPTFHSLVCNSRFGGPTDADS
jgi:hypothetical protein